MYVTSDGIHVSLSPAEAALLLASGVLLTLSEKSLRPTNNKVRFSSAV